MVESQDKLQNEKWKITGFVIGWDGFGNPIVLQKNGVIDTEDNSFGGVHHFANTFDELQRQ